MSSCASVRAGAILGSAVTLLLLFDAVLLKDRWDGGKGAGQHNLPSPASFLQSHATDFSGPHVFRVQSRSFQSTLLAHPLLWPELTRMFSALCINLFIYFAAGTLCVCPPLSSATKHVYVTTQDE